MTDPDEITEAWREHLAEEAAKRPLTYHEASTGNIADQMDRYRELAAHDAMAGAIAIGRARGTYEPNEHVNEQKFPPLTMAGHLEMLALGERIARYYRHPSQVDKAVKAGASWDQIAAATGTTVKAARAAYVGWAASLHRLHADMGMGLDDAGYAAALEAAGEPEPPDVVGDPAEDTRRLEAIRAVLAGFDWEHDDRQYALEEIERIAGGGGGDQEDDDDQADDHWRDYNYTCSACGGQIGMFIGRDGWQHYHGDGTTASPVEIYDAGHEATLAGGQP
jgi:hypothetical protein